MPTPHKKPRHVVDDPMLSVGESAADLNVSIRKIYGLLADGTLKGYRLGRTIRIRRSDLYALLTEYSQGA